MPNFKKIIMVITDARGVSQAFVTEDFQYLLLEEAIALVKRGILVGVHLVENAKNIYIRSNNNEAKEDNLDNLSAPAGSLSKKVKDPSEDKNVSAYVKAYGVSRITV